MGASDPVLSRVEDGFLQVSNMFPEEGVPAEVTACVKAQGWGN